MAIGINLNNNFANFNISPIGLTHESAHNGVEAFQYQINDGYTGSAGNQSGLDVGGQNDLRKFAASTEANRNKAEFSKYKVQSGDSLYKILLNAGFSKKEIAEKGLINQVARNSGLANPNFLRPGQNLNLPLIRSGINETVNVTADPTPIETTTGEVSSNITPRPLAEMPALDVGQIAEVTIPMGDNGPIETTPGEVSSNIIPRPLEEMPALDVGQIAEVTIPMGDNGPIETTPGEVSSSIIPRPLEEMPALDVGQIAEVTIPMD